VKTELKLERTMLGLSSRELLASGIYHSGVLAGLRRFARDWEIHTSAGSFTRPRLGEPRYVILSYHRVGVAGVPLYSRLEPAVFEAQMQYLHRYYRILSLETLVRELEHPTSAVPAVAVTFDDGYGDLFEYAFPILQKYEIPATIFAVAEAIESGVAPWYDRLFLALSLHPASTVTIELDGPTEFDLKDAETRLSSTQRLVSWLRKQPDSKRRDVCEELARRFPVPEKELEGRMLTWAQLRKMQAHGVSCGSHTLTHPVLSRVGREDRLRELRDSREILEKRLEYPVLDFAFPFGQPDDCAGVTESELMACGYRSAVTTIAGTNRCEANHYALRRVSIGEQRHLPLFAYRLNSLFLRGPDPSRGAFRPAVSRMAVTAAPRVEGR
jgi:peptidoglycan/xylan/chitin deacetylase (PgdA/CDA1 family)